MNECNRKKSILMKTKALLIILVSVLFFACRSTEGQHGHSHDAGGSHVHDARLYLVQYGPNAEFYAEADPLFAGGNSHFLIYLSRLEDFKPLDSAQIDLALEIGDKTLTVNNLKKVRAGQYEFDLQPGQAGTGHLLASVKSFRLPDGMQEDVFRVPVQVYEDEHQAHHALERQMPSPANAVAFAKTQSYLIDFRTETVQLENIGKLISSVAQILPSPAAQTEIIAKASGIISFDKRNVVEGQAVNKGEYLFSIESGGMLENSINQYVTSILNDYEKAKKDYEREKALAEDKIVSETELLQAKNIYEKALANYEQVKANFSEDRQIVRAPIDGYVKQISVQNGQYVSAGQLMATVSQNQRLLIQAELSSRYYPYLKDITEVNIREMNAPRAYSLEELHGRLVSYGQSASANNPLIPVIFEIDNVLDAIPGTFVNLCIKTSGNTSRLSVPNTAIVEEMGNYFVFVQLTPELFDKRPVLIGSSDGIRTEIISGLQAGERIVSQGAQIIKLSQGTGVLDPHAGHAH